MTWTKEKIKEGLQKYYNEFGRYPTAHEIDKYPYLPSSRQIQRRFGGLPELRKQLGIEITDYTRGETRSHKAEIIGKRGLNYEKDIQKILIKHFGEIFVHEQKPFNDYSGRLDFFVYAKDEKFGVDVFYAEDIHSLTGCINYKQRSYKGFSDTLILCLLIEVISACNSALPSPVDRISMVPAQEL